MAFYSYPDSQAQQHSATYISGFVIGVAPLCVTVTSSLIGYCVSILEKLQVEFLTFVTISYYSFLTWD